MAMPYTTVSLVRDKYETFWDVLQVHVRLLVHLHHESFVPEHHAGPGKGSGAVLGYFLERAQWARLRWALPMLTLRC